MVVSEVDSVDYTVIIEVINMMKQFRTFAVFCVRNDPMILIWCVQTCGWLNLLANMIDNFTHGLAVAGSFSVGIKVLFAFCHISSISSTELVRKASLDTGIPFCCYALNISVGLHLSVSGLCIIYFFISLVLAFAVTQCCVV